MFGFLETLTNTEVYTFQDKSSEDVKKNKVMVSLATMGLATMSIASQTNYILEPEIKTSDRQVYNQTVMKSSDEREFNKLIFYDNEYKSDTINMSNKKLEVDDLAEKVTQTQLDEVKDHIDTKISGLESNLLLELKNTESNLLSGMKIQERDIISSLKKYISDENDELKTSQISNRRFWISSIVIPLLSAGIGAVTAMLGSR